MWVRVGIRFSHQHRRDHRALACRTAETSVPGDFTLELGFPSFNGAAAPSAVIIVPPSVLLTAPDVLVCDLPLHIAGADEISPVRSTRVRIPRMGATSRAGAPGMSLAP